MAVRLLKGVDGGPEEQLRNLRGVFRVKVEEGWVELPRVPEVPIYSQESRKDGTQGESKASQTAGRGGPVSVLLGVRCAVVLEEVGVLVMPWRACRSALAVLKWNGGMLGGAEAELRYTVCTGDTLLPTTEPRWGQHRACSQDLGQKRLRACRTARLVSP